MAVRRPIFKLVKLFATVILGLAMVCILLFLYGVHSPPAAAAPLNTPISGPITVDTVLNLAGSPYTVSTVVNVQAKLTISPGVEIRFLPNAGLQITNNGQLEAIGTPAQPITFTSDSPTPARGDWQSISFSTAGLTGTIQYAVIEYAEVGVEFNSAVSGIQFNLLSNTFRYIGDGTSGSGAVIGTPDDTAISYNTIFSAQNGISLNEIGDTAIQNNHIFDIDQHCLAVQSTGAASSDNLIDGNQIHDCGGRGIWIDGGAGSGGSANEVNGNQIWNTNKEGLYAANQNNLSLRSNEVFSTALSLTLGAVVLEQMDGATLQNNYFHDNGTAGVYQGALHIVDFGPAAFLSPLVITGTRLQDSLGSGLIFRGTNDASAQTIHSNALCVDDRFEIKNQSSNAFTATAPGNWLGTNFSTAGTEITGTVDITPFIQFTAGAAPVVVPADGTSAAVITITMNDGAGHTMPVGARQLNLATSLGTLSDPAPTLDNSGAATSSITSNVAGTALITLTEWCGFPITTTVEFQATDVSIQKSTSVTQASPGDIITYTLAYSSSGAVATNVIITDTLPTGTVWLTDTAASLGFTRVQTSPQVVYDLGDLAPGSSGVITLVTQIPATTTATCGQGLTNSVVITTPTAESNTGNNTASTTLPTLICNSVISITKTAVPPGGSPVSPGDTITYSLVIHNNGGLVNNVTLTDTIPNGTAYVSGSATLNPALGGVNFNGSQVTVSVPNFPASTTLTTTFRVTVTTNLNTTITNQAALDSDQTSLTNSNVVTHPVQGTAISTTLYLPLILKNFNAASPVASLSWIAQNQDRVREVDGSDPQAFTPDGRNDGAFRLTVNVGSSSKTVTGIRLSSSQGASAAWDTPVNGVPVLGVFNGGTRLNNANGTINQTISGQIIVTLYASDDAGGTRFPANTYDYTVTVTFSDGSSVSAVARIPLIVTPTPTPTPVPPPPPCNVTGITVGNTPRGVAVDASRNRVYVANFGSGSISVIDSSSNTVLQTISGVTGANGIAYDSTQNIIWVTNRSSNQVTPIQANAGATGFTVLSPVSTGSGPWGVAYDPIHNYVYVVNNTGNSVTVIDAGTRSVVTTLSGSFSQPFHLAANPVTGKTYVANFGNHTVTVINGTAVSSVINLAVGDPSTQPYGVAVDETRNIVYVATVNSHRVVAIGTLKGTPDQLLGWAAFHRGFGDPNRPVPLRAIAVNPDIGSLSPMDDGGHVWMTTSTADGSEANQALLSPKGWNSYFHSPVPCNVSSNPGEGIAINRTLDRAYVTSGTNPGLVSVITDPQNPPLVPFGVEDGIGIEIFVFK